MAFVKAIRTKYVAERDPVTEEITAIVIGGEIQDDAWREPFATELRIEGEELAALPPESEDPDEQQLRKNAILAKVAAFVKLVHGNVSPMLTIPPEPVVPVVEELDSTTLEITSLPE